MNSLSGFAREHIEQQIYQNDHNLRPNGEDGKKNWKDAPTEASKGLIKKSKKSKK
jgi:hypothetical protein